MRILILSKEAWRDEQNGGNVLSNIFAGFDAEFAQIYCNENLPNNAICHHYFRITDKDMAKSILGKGRAGTRIVYKRMPDKTAATVESFSGGKKWLKSLMPVLRELVWWIGRWNEKEIKQFINEFNPNIIFAPCYGNHYMHRLTQLAKSVSAAPVISYISDDHYTNKQLRWEPWYWVNHLLLRRHTRQVFRLYSLVYTMTLEQKLQCEKDFKADMKILCKAGKFEDKYLKQSVNKPIRIVYAGGIYLNRWKTLRRLTDAIRTIDASGNTLRLDVYTNSQLSVDMAVALDDKMVSTVHPVVSSAELSNIYHQSDIALHCESFDIVNRYKVRLSFSTKIVDCLDSGCAVLAICDSRQAGLAYLKRNDAAICISNPDEIVNVLNKIKSTPEILIDYQRKAFALGRKFHCKSKIQKAILSDFEKYSKA